MTRTEAIILLLWCVPLSARLTAQGVNTRLTKDDRVTLKGFRRVWEGGWLDDANMLRHAGLSQGDIEALMAKMLDESVGTTQQNEISQEDTIATIQNHNVENAVTTIEGLKFSEAKKQLKAGQFDEALEKLNRLAATYQDDNEIRELIIQCLRAQRQPTKLVEKIDKSEEKFNRKSHWLSRLLATRKKIAGKSYQIGRAMATLQNQ